MKKQHDLLLYGEPTKSKNRFYNQRFAHMKTVDIIRWHDFNTFSPPLQKYWQRRIPLLIQLINLRKPHGLAMAKYIILVYDRTSPFVVEHRLMPDRKKAVLAFVGLNERGTTDQAKACTDLTDEMVVDALTDYLKWQDDYVWNMIVQNEEVFYNNQKQLFQGVSATNKDTDRFKASEYQSKLLEFNERIQKRIKALWVEFTGNDPDAEAKVKERKPLSPETIAEYEMQGADYKFSDDDGEPVISDEEE